LAGCGYLDGAEVREAVIALLELDKRGIEAQCFAPDIPQAHVVDHLTGEAAAGQSRNCLHEAARIARGAVLPLSDADMQGFDLLVLPGGFGVAKNLSSIAFDGKDASALPDFSRLALQAVAAGKPIVAICISPAALALALKKNYAPRVTIGDDENGLIEAFGGTHAPCATHETAVDDNLKIVSCSAYMRDDARLKDVAEGIANAVEQAAIWIHA